MDGYFTEAHRMFRKEVKRIVDREFRPGSLERTKLESYPVGLMERLSELGILGINMPVEYGGSPADLVSEGIVMEELSRVDPAACFWFWTVHQLGGRALAKLAGDHIKAKYLPPLIQGKIFPCLGATEPNAGNDLAGINTRAVRNHDHYVISGEKTSVSAGAFGKFILVLAITNPDAGYRGMSFFCVDMDTTGISRSRFIDTGLHSLGRAIVSFDNVKVPASDILGSEGEGFINVMKLLDPGRGLVALMAVGAAEESLDQMIEYSKSREAFGRQIAKFQGTSFKIVEDLTIIEAGKSLAYGALSLVDNGLPAIKELAMAKWFCTEHSLKVIQDCLVMHGHYGYSCELPDEQRLRDILSTLIMDGTPEIQRLIIVRETLGREYA